MPHLDRIKAACARAANSRAYIHRVRGERAPNSMASSTPLRSPDPTNATCRRLVPWSAAGHGGALRGAGLPWTERSSRPTRADGPRTRRVRVPVLTAAAGRWASRAGAGRGIVPSGGRARGPQRRSRKSVPVCVALSQVSLCATGRQRGEHHHDVIDAARLDPRCSAPPGLARASIPAQAAGGRTDGVPISCRFHDFMPPSQVGT